MPLPTPHMGEPKDKFMHRCMSNAHCMSKFPDEDQRAAVCMRQFKQESIIGKTRVTFREDFSFASDSKTRIDKEKGIIFDVKINSNKSKNRRKYGDPVLEKATPLYEDAKVYDDHEDPGMYGARSRKSLLGRLRQVRWPKEGGGHRGDFHVMPSKRESLLADAEWDSRLFGFSHNIVGDVSDKLDADGDEVCEAIHEVISVDLVSEPATTRGLFESKNNDEEESMGAGTGTANEQGSDKLVGMLEAQGKEKDAKIAQMTEAATKAKAEFDALKVALEGEKKAHGDLKTKYEALQAEAHTAKIEAELTGLSEAVAKSLRDGTKAMSIEAALAVIKSVKEEVGKGPEGLPPKPRSESKQPPKKGDNGGKADLTEDRMMEAFVTTSGS